MTLPFMLTERDQELIGSVTRSDPMGMLPIWSARGRDLVPHLTEQSRRLRGFQLLIEIVGLWPAYESAHSEHAGRLSDFFVLVEQAIARIVGHRDKDWELPGARRVRARCKEPPHISLRDPSWHLMGSQKANGVWGIYRGAARRAKLLNDEMTDLSEDTRKDVNSASVITMVAQNRLFHLVQRAMDGETVEVPTHGKNTLSKSLYDTYKNVPFATHLREKLLYATELTRQLSGHLLHHINKPLDHRAFLSAEAGELPMYEATLQDVVRCENLLAVLEGIFEWLCGSRGMGLEALARELPVDLGALASARVQFANSGRYGTDTGFARHKRTFEQLDLSSKLSLVDSVLSLHEQVSQERKRAPWIWEEHGTLHGDDLLEKPSASELVVGNAWRNDYYLGSLMNIAKEVSEVL